jgi:putative tricarboxylic transport membrane protein
MQNITRRLFGIALALGISLGIALPQAAMAWEPKRPVEFIIMAGQGGGADQIARLVQSIIEKHDLSPQPFIPINKPGGSGAEALQYLQSKAGNDHIVMITLNSFFTTPQLNPGLGVDITDFTPIGRLAIDTFLLWVHSDSDIQSLDDWVAAVKGAGLDWKMGGTGKGQEDSLVTGMLEDEFGLKMTYIPFPGGGTVAKNLIGKHIDSTVNNPAEQIGFFEAGQSRPLMALTPERLPQFPDVPTSAELGHPDLVYFMQRSIVAPPGVSQEVQDWYIDLFQKVNETEEWVAYANSDGLFRDWISGDELGEYFAQQVEVHHKLLKAMGEL